ncbi:GtrA family protein [Paraburkholderia mimosarum]|uniref:GtrA family protein n=1 Tax=Paraburkholderia mimosarum TaxID=312026 RepID=UPI0039C44581
MYRRVYAALRARDDARLFIRFIAVGVLNTLFGYACFALFLRLGLHYAAALLGATILGIGFNFKSTGSLVFNSHNNRLIVRFVLAYGISYGVNVLLLMLLSLTGWPAYVGGALSMPPIALLSFFLMKRFVFHGEPTVRSN